MGNDTKAILVPVDFTEAARQAAVNAIELGEQLNADVYLVNFLPPLKKKSPNGVPIDKISDELASFMNLLKENEMKLAEMLRSMGKSSTRVHSEIKIDRLASGIKKQLKKKDIGLIVIGIAGAHTIGDSFFRTRQVRELIEVDCPIMVCSNHYHQQYSGRHKIVVSLDFETLDQENVEHLAAIAEKLSCSIHYIHVNHPADSKHFNINEINKFLQKHRLKAQAVDVVNSSNKEKAIRDYADAQHADFVAISRVSKSSSYKGCDTEEVLEETASPVFVY